MVCREGEGGNERDPSGTYAFLLLFLNLNMEVDGEAHGSAGMRPARCTRENVLDASNHWRRSESRSIIVFHNFRKIENNSLLNICTFVTNKILTWKYKSSNEIKDKNSKARYPIAMHIFIVCKIERTEKEREIRIDPNVEGKRR